MPTRVVPPTSRTIVRISFLLIFLYLFIMYSYYLFAVDYLFIYLCSNPQKGMVATGYGTLAGRDYWIVEK